MRLVVGLGLFAALCLAHGESNRTQGGQGGVGPVVVPTGGPTDSPDGPAGGPVTPRPVQGRHTWDDWWAYNQEWFLAKRLRGTPTSGLRIPDNDRRSRKELREKEIYPLMLKALEDKHHDVRAAAAIALGKFGNREADRWLGRHLNFPGEGWFDVREAAIYGTALLGLDENRNLLKSIANDEERSLKERSLPLIGYLMDGTQVSADELVMVLRFFRSGVRTPTGVAPVNIEWEQRRFAAHLLGFVELDGYDNPLGAAAAGGRAWKEGEQGLALTALGRRRAEDHRGLVWRLLYDRAAHKDVHRSAAIALGMMLDHTEKDEIKRLGRFVRDSKSDNIAQHFAVMALANIGGEAALDVLEDLLASNVLNNDDDRAFLWLAIGIVGERVARARETLMVVYEKERSVGNWGVQAMALALARHAPAAKLTLDRLDRHRRSTSGGSGGRVVQGGSGGRAVGGSGAGAGDESKDFALWGVLALGLHGEGSAVPLIRELFKEGDAAVRGRAAIALTLIQRSAVVPELVDVLRNAGTMHRKAAVVTALALLHEPSRAAFDALKRAYEDDSLPNTVRAMAIVALGAMGDPREVPLSAQLMRNWNYFIRCLALDEIASFL